MTTNNTVTLAREVLDAYDALDKTTPGTYDRSRAGAMYAFVSRQSAPDLARAVLRMEALAGMLDHEAKNYVEDEREMAERYAARIRTELSGESS